MCEKRIDVRTEKKNKKEKHDKIQVNTYKDNNRIRKLTFDCKLIISLLKTKSIDQEMYKYKYFKYKMNDL